MSSMLSKNQLKYRDLQGYLFIYDRNTVETAEVWAQERSKGFEPGMMVFCLEKVNPQNAVVIGRKDDGDSYKVSDLCFVVGEDDSRPLGVNMTSNVYDLRFIEALLCEKAQKAILNEKDFLYVACKPAAPLDQAKIHEIEQVGAVYAMGGSRRALVVDTNGPNEPAMALLSLMGANITPTGIGRQLLDIGNVCSLLFSSDSRQQDDQNKVLIRSIYSPIPAGNAAAVESNAARVQGAPVWQAPTGQAPAVPGVANASAPPAPNFNHSNTSPSPGFSGPPAQTWGVPSKFEETKAGAGPSQPFVTDIPPTPKPTDFSQMAPQGNFPAQQNSPFQEIPQAPPMSFGGGFAPPAAAAPPAPEAPLAPPAPDFASPTEFEQHFNPQPYFEETPQTAPASEQELKQAFEQHQQAQLQAPPAPAPVESPAHYSDVSTESAWFAPSEAETAQASAPAQDAPVVIPPRFPTSMYGSSTAAAIPYEAPAAADSPAPASFQEHTITPEPTSALVWDAPPAITPQPVVAETTSAENMALPSLEELGIQPPAQAAEEAAPVTPPNDSAQWWPAQEMQQPLLDQQVAPPAVEHFQPEVSYAEPVAEEKPIEQHQQSAAELAWGVAPPEPTTYPGHEAPSAPETVAPQSESFAPAQQAPLDLPTVESVPSESAQAESFMHAQPTEPGNIAPEIQTQEDIKQNPALLWMAQEEQAEVGPETVADNFAPGPIEPAAEAPSEFTTEAEAPTELPAIAAEAADKLPEPPAQTFFEQAAQVIKPEIPASPFAHMQKQNLASASSVVPADITAFSQSGELPTSEDTLILSAVKDAQIQASKAAAPKPKPQSIQDPKLVMKETALLMNKLEHQVAEAAKRLNSRSESVKQRLNRQVEELLETANESDKKSQSETTELANKLSTNIAALSQEIRQQLGETSSGGRYTIKQLFVSNQNDLEAKQTALESELKAACDKFKEDAQNFAIEAEKKLQDLVDHKTTEIEILTEKVLDHLEDTNSDFVKMFENRFNRFKERIGDEATSVKQSLERNVRSMFEEVEGSWERASDKLQDNQHDFEQRISHSVKTAKLITSENSKQMIATNIFPLVKERRAHLQKLIDELTKRFQQESNKQAEAQLNGLEASLTEARSQLQNLVSDCLESINSVGKQQQAGLEDAFKDTSVQAETATLQIKSQLNEAHKQITDTEATCRSLVESSNLDTEVELTEVRNATTQSVKTAKQEANSKLQETIEEHSNNLDRLSNKVQTDINAERLKQTKAAREASEQGLSRLREAIQEAVAAVQAARERYMD